MVVVNPSVASCFAVACALALGLAPAALGAFASSDPASGGEVHGAPPLEAPAAVGDQVLALDDPARRHDGGETDGKDPLSHVSSCKTGPPVAGMGQCSFTCSAENAGSYAAGSGTISMRCGEMECSVAVPEFTGCDLLGVDRGTVGLCRFEGIGAGWCGSF